MHTENLCVNASTQWQEVKNFTAVAPDDDVAILLDALLVETVNLSDLATLVISTDQCYTLGVATFQRHQEDKNFY